MSKPSSKEKKEKKGFGLFKSFLDWLHGGDSKAKMQMYSLWEEADELMACNEKMLKENDKENQRIFKEIMKLNKHQSP